MTDNTHNDLSLDELSARRDKQGLSVADMANRIKVSREIINYIEQGEFDRIGSATFIRGHVSNYARELNLDPQLILSLVPAQHLKPYEPRLSSSKVSSPLSRVKTHSSGFGRYVLGTFLVAALGLSFYFVYDKWDSNQSDQVIQVAQESSDLATNDSAKKKVIYSSLLPQAELADENKPAVKPQTTDDAGDTGIMMESFDQEDAEDIVEPQNSDLIDEVGNQTTQQFETTPPTTSEQARYSIRFDLSEQAWVAIKTQDGDNVVSDLIGPGERQYNADEPLNFRIGNAANLKLYINGQVVDLSAHTRQDVAVFNWPLNEG